MLDTIRLRLNVPPWFSPVEGDSGNWKYRSDVCNNLVEPVGGAVPVRYFFQHKETGLRVISDYGGRWALECSLPRVLFGTNGRLIVTDGQKAEAVRAMLGLLNEIGNGHLEPQRVDRLDVVWQFRVSPAQFCESYRTATHPHCRRFRAEYSTGGLSWVGKQEVVRAYDKELEQRGTEGGVLRVEVQARGDVVERFSWRRWSDFQRYDVLRHYVAYRAEVLALSGQGRDVCPSGGLTPIQVLACEAVQGNRRAVDLYLKGKGRRTRYYFRRVVEQMRREMGVVDLADMLPATELPEVVEVAA